MANIPGAYSKVQVEETEFRSSTGNKVMTKIGAIINKAIDDTIELPLGSIEMSMVTEAQFQSLRNAGWVLCDNRSIVGSALNLLTGQTNATDGRGRFSRGKDNGRGLDPNGDSPINTLRAQSLKIHSHAVSLNNVDGCATSVLAKLVDDDNDLPGVVPTDINLAVSLTINASGIAESRPNNITVNCFIRIN